MLVHAFSLSAGEGLLRLLIIAADIFEPAPLFHKGRGAVHALAYHAPAVLWPSGLLAAPEVEHDPVSRLAGLRAARGRDEGPRRGGRNALAAAFPSFALGSAAAKAARIKSACPRYPPPGVIPRREREVTHPAQQARGRSNHVMQGRRFSCNRRRSPWGPPGWRPISS